MTQKTWWWVLGIAFVVGLVWFLLAQAGGNRGEGELRTTPEAYQPEQAITPPQEPATPQSPQPPTGAPTY